MTIKIYQIYYDNTSRKLIDANFIPLDNSLGDPTWFEFLPMLNQLEKLRINDDDWLGFLSPKFYAKTGYSGAKVIDLLNKFNNQIEVALFSPAWDQLAYFKNPFEQCEFRHPGSLEASQNFFKQCGIDVDLKKLVTHSTTSVFSNYVIAKGSYWKKWVELGRKFYEHVEKDRLGDTQYLDAQNFSAPMKVFIQERFPSIILTLDKFRVLSPDFGQSFDIFDQLFDNNPRARKMLQTCDLMKEKYTKEFDQVYLDMYYRIRQDIRFKQPHPRAIEFINS